ncbi:MAG: hypothetical protein KAU26_02345 [Methylococcales bacterium]|nr:hypothetical protein [Methylococcales bacterium]
MSYKKFTLEKLKSQFDIEIQKQSLFSEIEELEQSAWLIETLNNAKLIPLNSEKVKSELIIMPILIEILKKNQHKISLYSGILLNADNQQGLNGECNFIFSNQPQSYFLESPIFALVEAKNDNIDYGLAQCIAQMLGAVIFNKKHEVVIPCIYGCITNSDAWQFLKLEENRIIIDDKRHYLDNISGLLGIFQTIINTYP